MVLLYNFGWLLAPLGALQVSFWRHLRHVLETFSRFVGKVRIELSLQSQLDLEGLGRPEIDDFRYFLRARILAAFLMLFLTTFIDF